MTDEVEVFGLDDELPEWAEEDEDDVPPDEPDNGDDGETGDGEPTQ